MHAASTPSGIPCAKCRAAMPRHLRICPSCGAQVVMPERIGEYEVLGLIGEGGMGRVFRAIQPRLKRTVCIKTLLPHCVTELDTVMRFQHEAIHTAQLRHPNVVAVHDVGQEPNGAPYMVMELLDGVTLRQVIASEAPLPFARARALIDQVLAGLGEAHAAGMVHRDLKPANVMVVRDRNGAETCKVLDFGIARCLDSEGKARLTQTGLVPGTPGYIAPEQIVGEAFDHRADLYSAGVLMYELLCGKRPHHAGNAAQLMHLTVMEDPPPPSTRTVSQVPAAADAVVLKALARDPAQRFQSANAFRAALAKGSELGPVDTLEIDTTPLAVRLQADASLSHARSLVSGVFQSDGWERAKMSQALVQRLDELLAGHHIDELHEAVQTIEALSRGATDPEAAAAAHAALFEAASQHYALLLEWLRRPATRALAKTLLNGIGKRQLDRMLESLGEVDKEYVSGLYEIVSGLESPRELIERLSLLERGAMRRCLAATAVLSDAAFEPLLHCGLLSSVHEVRLAVLESLTEGRAFRFLTAVRARLHDPDARVRGAALRWVTQLEDERAVRELQALLQRPSIPHRERLGIYDALRMIGGPGAVELLKQGAHDAAATPEVRAICQRALVSLHL